MTVLTATDVANNCSHVCDDNEHDDENDDILLLSEVNLSDI